MLEQIKKDLNLRLSEHRYRHTESVVKTALEFAQIFGFEDLEKIEIAAWLHDCCKELSNEELLGLAEKYGIEIYDEDRSAPNVLHARVGAKWAAEKYAIDDTVILEAIEQHTLGATEMHLSAKILYLADMLEPLRGDKAHLEAIRKIVYQDKNLDAALLQAMQSKIDYTIKKGGAVHPVGIQALNALK